MEGSAPLRVASDRVLICGGPRAQPQLWDGGPWSPVSLVPPPEVFLGLLAGLRPLPSPSPGGRSEGPELCSSVPSGRTEGRCTPSPHRPPLPYLQPCSGITAHTGPVPASLWPAPSLVAPGWLLWACPQPRTGSCWPRVQKPRPRVWSVTRTPWEELHRPLRLLQGPAAASTAGPWPPSWALAPPSWALAPPAGPCPPPAGPAPTPAPGSPAGGTVTHSNFLGWSSLSPKNSPGLRVPHCSREAGFPHL